MKNYLLNCKQVDNPKFLSSDSNIQKEENNHDKFGSKVARYSWKFN